MDRVDLLQRVLGEVKTPIFLAGFDIRHSQLTLHVSEERDVVAMKAAAQRAAATCGEPIEVTVCTHRLRNLAQPRSLEHWLRKFDVDEIIHDPTMVISRARALLATAKSLRANLGSEIAGLFVDPQRRVIFALTRSKNDPAALSAVNLRLRTMVPAGELWSAQAVDRLPNRELVPIDASSASTVRGLRRAIRRWFAPLAVALALFGIGTAPAAAAADPTHAGRKHAISGQAITAKIPAQHKFGMLGALSVFGDNPVPYEIDAFAAAGLQRYFGGGDHAKGIQVAYKHHREDLKRLRIQENKPTPPAGPERGQGGSG
jgi:hypothetical protein